MFLCPLQKKKCKYDSTPLLVLRNGNPVEIFINLTSHLKVTLSGYSREIYCYSFCLRVDEVLQSKTTVHRHVDEDVSDGRLVACSAARLSSLLLFSCCSAGPGEDRCSSRSVRSACWTAARQTAVQPGFCDVQRPPMFVLFWSRAALSVWRSCQKDARFLARGEMGWVGRGGGGAWLTFRERRPPPRSRQKRKERRVGKLRRWTQLAAICVDF